MLQFPCKWKSRSTAPIRASIADNMQKFRDFQTPEQTEDSIKVPSHELAWLQLDTGLLYIYTLISLLTFSYIAYNLQLLQIFN